LANKGAIRAAGASPIEHRSPLPLFHAMDVLTFIFQTASSAVLAVLAFVGLAPTKLGERFLNYHLERKLAALKYDHDQQIEELKAKLAHLGDRGVRSNEREFNAISVIWENFVDAFVATLRAAVAFTGHPDLSKLSDEDVIHFLDSTTLSDEQKNEVTKASDKNKTFSDFVNRNYIAEAGKAIFDARSMVRKQAIFMPDDIQRSFDQTLDTLSKAQVQRSMEPFYGAHSKLGAVDFLLINSDKIFRDLLTAVRHRMLRELVETPKANPAEPK
jgi:hypothetical protein